MITISDRILFLLLGCGVGFVFGYIVRSLTCIQRDLKEITDIKKHDDGVVQNRVVLNVALAIVVGLTVWASITSQLASNKSNDAVNNVKNSNVVNCQNGNESRQANHNLWNFILDASLAGGKNQTPKQIKYIHQIRHWIAEVYQPHDCTDLTKKYPIPPPPKIIDVTTNHKHKHK